MKDPKAFFPIIFASSWIGNLILTVIAFFLAFTSDEPLTPVLFLTVAVCILAGNALPISVYWIFARAREAELAAEMAEIPFRVREALSLSEDVVGRLDEAEGALSKGILLARQVPERINESFTQLQELSTKLETLDAESFTDALQKQSESVAQLKELVEGISKPMDSLKSAVDGVRSDVKDVPDSMGKLLEQVTAAQKAEDGDSTDVATADRLDLLFESIETVQESLDSLLLRVVELKIQATPPPFAMEPEAEPDIDEEEEKEEPEEQPEEEPPQEEPEEILAEDIEEEPEPVQEPEPDLSVPEDEENGQRSLFKDGKTRLVVNAMIGMQNKLFVRGDEPWLSWEDGQLMELIGIGEFSWAIDDLRDSIEVNVLLNDELVAEGGSITLEPGKTKRVHLRFPED
ncbi:MAG: hypothetical protein AB3N63_07480 [Puniceicoccaceae bacterium]